ncbi:beta-propeller domain-containing protein [Paenibacillus cymbidii]|uniref:beta-propeller domain-containing protein n=1 Tax=Paenibacillus cymbidii TaxID=1639034 RepID=UPI0010813094|nr:beta-propeller domain-containing protein [Paenibacillus cymbidii]
MMKKKFAALTVALALTVMPAVSGISTAAGTEADYAIVIDGAQVAFDPPPRLSGDTMMVPLRSIADVLGITLDWSDSARTISAVKGDTSVTLTIGSTAAERNGQPMRLAAAPAISHDKTLVPLRFFAQTFGMIVAWDGINQTVTLDSESGALPTVGSYAQLKELLQEMPDGYALTGVMVKSADGFINQAGAEMPMPAPQASAAGSAAKESGAAPADHSETNVQVQGVDEGDIVKTDGTYIYQVNGQRIVIAQAYPASEMKLVATLPFADRSFQPQELYIDDNRLIVIGMSYSQIGIAVPEGGPAVDVAPGIMEKRLIAPYPSGMQTTKAIVYDTSDKAAVKQVREVELQGNYLTSRKIGSSLYLLANQYVNVYAVLNEKAETPAPMVKDSAAGSDFQSIGYDQVRYFPHAARPNYLLVAGIDLGQPDSQAQVNAYLGAGDNVYASTDNLYVTLTQYPAYDVVPMPAISVLPAPASAPASMPSSAPATAAGQASGSAASQEIPAAPPVNPPEAPPIQEEASSTVYKFRLDGGRTAYAGSGSVPGTVLNQFSMDEYGGYFRIATTSGNGWSGQTERNNMYVLDEALHVTGKIEGIAPGEKIYSVRFMGKRGYMVTFKKVDPLFAIDLSDPQQPAILGQLKIPGYSDYLHPFDETHLIGFGKDAIEVANEWAKPAPGSTTPATTAYYQGMKLALFDVTDVTKPVQLYQELIGDRGTDSEVLHNHKALLFDQAKGLLAFPVTLMKVPANQQQQSGGFPAYGQFAYQGAYVYDLSLEHGFKLEGTITHMSTDDIAKAGTYGYDMNRYVQRVLYIGDTLYTLSNGEIRANDMATLAQTGSVRIP